MRRISRSLLAGALLLGGVVVGGGAQVAQAACASGQVTFSGTVSNGGNNTTVHLAIGNPGSESGWTDFDLATIDWAGVIDYAASQVDPSGEPVLTLEQVEFYTGVFETANFTDMTSSGAYEICVSSDALEFIGMMMSASNGGGQDGSGGGQDGGGGGQGGGTVTAPQQFRALAGESPSFGYQIIAIPGSLATWTPGATAPALGATPSAIKSNDECSVSCSFTAFAMAAPTIWGQDKSGVATDVYLNFWGIGGGGGALADIPTVEAGDITKFAAAFAFESASTYSIVGGSFIETSFARIIDSSGDATPTIGYVENGNLSGTFVDSDGNLISTGSVHAEIHQGEGGTRPTSPTSAGSGIADFWDNGRGLFLGNIASGVTYEITAEVSGAPDSVCYVTNTGGVLALALAPASSGCEIDTDSDDDGVYELTITPGDATAPFVVMSAVSGDPVSGAEVGVGVNYYGWFQDDWSTTGDDGVVGWSPISSGYYRITLASPVDDVSEGEPQYLYTVYFVDVTVDGSGTVTINQVCTGWDYSGQGGSAIGCDDTPMERNADDRFVFSIPTFDESDSSNVKFTVTNEGEPVHRSRVRLEQLNTGGWYQYLYETDTNNLGAVAFALDAGKYKVTANPAWGDTSGMAAADLEFCMTPAGPTDCSGNSLGQEISISLASPNVTGTVWLDEIGGDVARHAWGNIEAFNPIYRFWQGISNVMTDDDGAFRIALDPAERPYRINVEPPWGTAGLSRAKVYVFVENSGICVVANENVTTCGGEYESQIDIVYPTPNFAGTVTAGGSGTWAYLQGEVWNGTWWQWGNVWAQTNMRGEFAVNLEANPAVGDLGTFYKITANPQLWDSGYSRTEKIVEMRDVDSDGTLDWCLTSTNAYGIPVACDDDGFKTDGEEIDIALRGANFVGLATDSISDLPLANAYVEVVQPSTWGGWTWLTSAQTNGTGVFKMSIELNSSDWTEIEVRVNPPWGGSSVLVKEVRSYWVGDEDGDGIATDICTLDPTDSADCEAAGGQLVDPEEEETFDLSGGNLNGTVLDPTTDPDSPAPFIQLQVDKVVEQDWNNDGTQDSTWYQWMSLWAQSNANGEFSIQVDDVPTWGTDLVEGTFRVTATPWGRSDVAAKSIEFCIVAEEVDADCDGDADGSEVVDITLAEPNVQGVTQTTDGTVVPNAWVSLEKKVEYDWDGPGGSDPWVWWSYTGRGGQTNSDGEFSMFVDVTDTNETYRLSVNPPWNWQGSPLVRFNSEEFDLSTGGVTSVDFSGAQALVFPAPKLQLTIIDQAGNPVPQSWLSVEKLQEYDWNTDGTIDWSWWQWQDSYGSTNLNGDVALNPTNLDPASDDLTKWRVVVNPPWNGTNSSLPRFESVLYLLTDENPDPGSITAELAYPAANFTGTVYSTGEALGSTVTPMRWGWIQVESFDWNDNGTPGNSTDDYMQNINWVAGGNSNEDGEFSMRVDNGGVAKQYLVRFYSNGWGTWAPPVEALVTFNASGQVSSWVYRIAPDDQQCGGPGCSVDVYFDHTPPNVHLLITNGGAITEGKAWVKFINLDDFSETSMTGASDGEELRVTGLVPTSGNYQVRITYKDDSDNVTCGLYDGGFIDVSGAGFDNDIDLADGTACDAP